MRHISSFERVLFAQSTRKHRIGRLRMTQVMTSATPVITAATDTTCEEWSWLGRDERGLMLEITAVVLDQSTLLVIHVMPHEFRRS